MRWVGPGLFLLLLFILLLIIFLILILILILILLFSSAVGPGGRKESCGSASVRRGVARYTAAMIKSLIILVLLIIALGGAALSKPSQENFADFYAAQAAPEGSGFLKGT